jgi:hypothetical protein
MPSNPIRQACRNRSGPISPCSKSLRNMPSTRRANSRAKLIAHRQRQPPKILAVTHQDVEGVNLDLMIVHPVVQPVEIRNAVDAEQHRFAIDHERAVPVSQRGLGDQREAAAPVVAVPCPQPNAVALALNDQTVAVMFDVVEPVRASRNRRATCRDARFKRGFGIACGLGYSALAELRYPHLDRHKVVHSIDGELPSRLGLDGCECNDAQRAA